MDVGSLIRSWLNSVLRRKARNTYLAYKRCLYRFEDSLPANCHITQVSVEHLERYILSLPFPASTVNTHLSAIKAFYNWLEITYDVPNIGQKVKCLKKSLPKQRVFTQTEYEKLLSICVPDEKRIVEFLATTGLRSCGLRSISEGSFRNGFVYVRSKGNKFRAVPLCERALKASSPVPYFVNLLKNFQQSNRLYYFIKHLCKRAGIPQAGPHALRHLCATTLIKKDVSRSKAAAVLGITTETLENVYVHLISEIDLKSITDCLDD